MAGFDDPHLVSRVGSHACGNNNDRFHLSVDWPH
jgi:hypothetical protein